MVKMQEPNAACLRRGCVRKRTQRAATMRCSSKRRAQRVRALKVQAGSDECAGIEPLIRFHSGLDHGNCRTFQPRSVLRLSHFCYTRPVFTLEARAGIEPAPGGWRPKVVASGSIPEEGVGIGRKVCYTLLHWIREMEEGAETFRGRGFSSPAPHGFCEFPL